MQATDLQKPPGHCVDVKVKVEGHPGLERRGAAVVNTDSHAFREALARRRAIEGRDQRIADLEQNVSGLTAEITEMKEMLKCLLDLAKS